LNEVVPAQNLRNNSERKIWLSLGWNDCIESERLRMKSKQAMFLSLFVGLLMLSFPAFGHHGGSEYDQDHPVTLKGNVTEYDWNNPHCQIFVDVKDDKGNVVHWSIETFAPAVMKRAGWSRETLHVGDEVSITVVPSKKGNPVGMVRKVVLPNGKELTGGVLGEQAPQ
jgi:hypothetical protein